MNPSAIFSTLLVAPAIFMSASVSAEGKLENPQDNSLQSGIGIFSGWYCDADKIEIVVDDRPAKTAAYGTARNDTKSVCGDTDNGFGLLFAFNIFGPGIHRVRALADGVEFDSATFSVDFLDSGYIRGLSSWVDITIPELGKEATLIWQESMQGYVISDVQDLDFSLEDILNAVSGHWSGTWQSAWASGGTFSMNLTKVQIEGNKTMQPTSVTISDTGCAEQSQQATPIMSFDDLSSNVVMTDGSEVEIEFLGTESVSGAAGTFVFDSGPCKGLDGVFTLFK